MSKRVARMLRRMSPSCTRQKESTRVATGMRPYRHHQDGEASGHHDTEAHQN